MLTDCESKTPSVELGRDDISQNSDIFYHYLVISNKVSVHNATKAHSRTDCSRLMNVCHCADPS